MSFDSLVGGHYGSGDLLERILDGLKQAGKDPSALTAADLVPVDAFHSRGQAATVELAELAGITSADRVLDVGCGLGGTGRHLAAEFGCRVEGLDLTEEYVTVGNRLNDLVGLADRVELQVGNALRMPHEDHTFHVAWTDHVQMNIEDKNTFYNEIARVLRPGGRLVFHDVFLGSKEPQLYPVPWAEDPSLSFLATESQARAAIVKVGLEIQSWVIKTTESAAFFERAVARIAEKGNPPLGIHLLMGNTTLEKLRNYACNLREERVTVVMGMAFKKD